MCIYVYNYIGFILDMYLSVAYPDIRAGGHIKWRNQTFTRGQFKVSQYLTFISSVEGGVG